MRIIKLSAKDCEFPDRPSVDVYFTENLPTREPVGKFLITHGRIRSDGIRLNEIVIFSYKSELTHTAKAASGRLRNTDENNAQYPWYFLVDVDTIRSQKGKLCDIEEGLLQRGMKRNLVQTRGWPTIRDHEVENQILDILSGKYCWSENSTLVTGAGRGIGSNITNLTKMPLKRKWT